MGDGLTGETREGLEVEGFGEGRVIEDLIIETTGWKSLGVLGNTWLWNLLEAGWEGELLDWWPIELGNTSTSSPSSSSLPSALGSVGESEILLNLFTAPLLFILDMGTSELE
ncbi:hypothetical protein O181_018439 [Austropuccinia psidii MF-1]|uniref:Uncharacterized protein n=1 Tax=Austropuccinia psidii MF-1 TaxID=1389203 RepID=A0A9Q3C5B0_9BASI|nr:hypothetical protein [Austropuccinia psidii MF-1]